MALNDQKKLDEAIAEYRQAIEIDPKFAPAHYGLGLALYDQKRLDDAIAEYRKAIEIDPKYAFAHSNLGMALHAQKKLDEAIAEYRQAIEIDPKLVPAHYNLGNALYHQNKLDEAIAEYRKAIEIDPKFAPAHCTLGLALRDQKKLDEAIFEYRAAIRIDPNLAEAYCNLGHALGQLGRFPDALAAMKTGHTLGSPRADWPYPSAHWVREAERLVQLDAKLSRVLNRESSPADAAERIQLANLCQQPYKQLHVAAVRFYEEAFAAEPKLADDLGAFHRYNAACAAALAGCGQGKDAGMLDDTERARLRLQALDWLRADLVAWGRLQEKEPDKVAPVLTKTMQRWQQDTDFAGVRGPEAIAKLPGAERMEWQKLWADVGEMLKQAQGKAMPEKQ
jgi:tetratricopeptide (TPR) repeat protein